MTRDTIINKLDKIDVISIEPIKSKLKSLNENKDILYLANISVFQSSDINHKTRLALLKKIKKISKDEKDFFSVAHNSTLAIKVSKELGICKNLIKDSHKTIDLWKKVINEPLAVNGLIFSYTDLGILYSDNKLHSLALKYLAKAESLLSECDGDYNPFIKLYVAYALIYSRINKNKKSNFYYNKVIKRSEKRNDTLTLNPILVNMADDNVVETKLRKET